jgi:hypothetical protein
MLTNSSNTEIRQDSRKLAPAKSARATMSVLLLFVLAAHLEAGQNGLNRSGYPAGRPSAHPNYSAPSAKAPAVRGGTAPGGATGSTPGGMVPRRMTPAPGNAPTNASSRMMPSSPSHTAQPMNTPGNSAKSFTPSNGQGASSRETGANGGQATATNLRNGNMNPYPNPGAYAGNHAGVTSNTNVTNVTNTYINNRGRESDPGYRGRERDPGSSMGRSHAGRIPENHFRSHFGGDHEFHINPRMLLAGGHEGHRRFQFGGVRFGIVEPWPAAWRETDAMYIDYIGGAYMLCNRAFPSVRVPVSIEDCAECDPAPMTATCDSCTPAPAAACTECASSSSAAGVTTLARGQTIAEVVAILGAPARAVDLGAKQIYLYQNMKVTFVYGRMSDVI